MQSVDAPCIIVTSGPTRAYFDRVRYIANTSSGALGARIVEALTARGLRVIHLYGLGSEQPQSVSGALYEPVEVTTVGDVIKALGKAVEKCPVKAVIHAMAVLDYIPERTLDGKKQSGDASWTVTLVRTPKIIGMLRVLLPGAFLVGFKLEAGVTEEMLIEKARLLLYGYNLDLVVANDCEALNGTKHPALFIGRNGKVVFQASTKEDIAGKLAGIVAERIS